MKVVSRVREGVTSYMQRKGLVMAVLAAVVDKIDAVPESQRAWYVERDGKFHVDLEKVVVEDVSPLRVEAAKANREAAERRVAMKELEKKYEGIDPEKYREWLAKFDADDEGKLIKDGKLDDVIARRTEKLKADHQKQLEAEQAKTKVEQQEKNQYRDRVLDNAIRAAASKAGVHGAAIEDALLRARLVFTLDKDGNAVQVKDGAIVYGKDASKPFSPLEWLEGMKETAPHWFPASASGGGAGGGGGGAGEKTMKRAAFDALTPAERAKISRSHKIVE